MWFLEGDTSRQLNKSYQTLKTKYNVYASKSNKKKLKDSNMDLCSAERHNKRDNKKRNTRVLEEL